MTAVDTRSSFLSSSAYDRLPRPPLWAAAVVVVWFAMVVAAVILGGSARSNGLQLCAFKNFTGVPCPTCGSTRLSLGVLSGDFGSAFLYNPFVFVALIVIGGWLVTTYVFRRRVMLGISRAWHRRLWLLIALLFLLNWAYVIAVDGPWANPLQDALR